jgi:uncharacterized membrane protein
MLVGLVALFVISLGTGIWNQPVDYSNWNYRIFYGICHQIQDRSFHINGVPMAVNTRCFGIFSGLLAAWLMVPYLAKITRKKKWPGILLSVSVIIQVIDYTAGQLSIWNSSNFSRFFLGIILGIALVCMIADQFNQK